MYTFCPQCSCCLELVEINCAIFRCGVFKTTFDCIPPHASREEILAWLKEDAIYGCGAPFELVNGTPVICDYK